MQYLIEYQLKGITAEAIEEAFKDTRWEAEISKIVFVKPPDEENILGRVIFRLKER